MASPLGVWRSLEARFLGMEEAPSSNLGIYIYPENPHNRSILTHFALILNTPHVHAGSMKSKLKATLLCTLMIASALAGCAGSDDDDEDPGRA